MKKFIYAVILGLLCIQLTGCSRWVVRTSSSTEARVDQEIKGNRGFIQGEPTSAPKEPAFTERKVYRVDVEIPTRLLKQKQADPATKTSSKQPVEKPEDKAIWGNRGYLQEGAAEQPSEEKPASYKYTEEDLFELSEEEAEGVLIEEVAVNKVVEEVAAEEQQALPVKVKKQALRSVEIISQETMPARTYKVQKGDTLQKISQRFYGTTKKWSMLFQANADKLTTPDRVYPGQVLVIPE